MTKLGSKLLICVQITYDCVNTKFKKSSEKNHRNILMKHICNYARKVHV